MSNWLKYAVLEQITGPIVFPPANISDETKIRFVIENASGGNTMVVSARINGQTDWDLLATITGNDKSVVTVSTYDELKLECTSYASASNYVKVVASSFNDAGGSTTIDAPSGGQINSDHVSFTSSDDSVIITANPINNTIDFVTAETSPQAINVSYSNAESGLPANNAQDAIDETVLLIQNHINDSVDAHSASSISNSPSGNLAATDVQSALDELQTNIDSSNSNVDDLVTLSGVPANSVDLGTFNGNLITDNSTIKSALQDLENSIEGLPDPITYEGTWNASTNTPTLLNTDVDKNGNLYQVTVAGTVDFGAGPITFEENDKVVNNGTIWEKWDQTDAVNSVNGKTGAVILVSGDIAESTNLYFQDSRAQTAAVVNSIAGSETVKAPSVIAVKTYVTEQIENIQSPGDLLQDSDDILNNQNPDLDIAGFAFSNASVRSFDAQVAVSIEASPSLNEKFNIQGVQIDSDWIITIESSGQDSLVSFNITDLGQMTYTSGDIAGFISGKVNFKAQVTNV